MSLILVFAAALLVAGLIAGLPAWRAHRRALWARRPFPPAWRRILRERVPMYRRLPPDLQAQVRRCMLVFLAEVPFIGCAGLAVTEEMRVTVAALAAMLRLNRAGRPFPALRQVLLYPGPFAVERVHTGPGGVQQVERQALSGESWQQGQVILSWTDVLRDAAQPDRPRNVVLHEFAHQLDQGNGGGNGAPALGSAAARERWSQVMNAEFDALRARLAGHAGHHGPAAAADPPGPAHARGPALPPTHHGTAEPLTPYAATHPAEFFAVTTEAFFGAPTALAARHPALFDALHDYYTVDPREWG